MSKLMQLYNLTFPEAMRLTQSQVSLLEDVARTHAIDLLETSPEFQKALMQRIAPVGREIRAVLNEKEAPAGPTGIIIGPPPNK